MLESIKNYGIDVGVHCIWWLAHLLVFFGFGLLLNEFLVAHGAILPVFADWFLDLAGGLLATISLFLVSISIYFEHRGRQPPSRMSRKFSAPFMMVLSIAFVIVVIQSKGLGATMSMVWGLWPWGAP